MTDFDPSGRQAATGHDPYWRPAVAGYGPYGPPFQTAPPPGLAKTILITIFFGLFGLIPAYLDSRRAEETGHPGGRYWVAFGVSLAGSTAVWLLALLAGAAFLFSTADTVSQGSESAGQAAPTLVPSAPVPPPSSRPNADGTMSCEYVPDTSGNPNLEDVGTPPRPDETPTQGTATLLMRTNQGDLRLTLDRSKAPCAAASFVFLTQRRFFDGSPCHREVNEPTFGVLQCGDPTGSGSGGASYSFDQEIPPGTDYPRGTVAMANTGQPRSTGSQFFLCFTDTQLSPDYTPVGTVDEAGLSVLDTIAAAGNDGSFASQAGGGAPNLPVTITTMTVAG